MRLRAELTSRLRENKYKENEICSRMKCVSAGNPGAITRCFLLKKVLLKISQISEENTCVGASF